VLALPPKSSASPALREVDPRIARQIPKCKPLLFLKGKATVFRERNIRFDGVVEKARNLGEPGFLKAINLRAPFLH